MQRGGDKKWMAAYTKPRCEKKVAERLETSGFEVYCPLQTTIRQWSDRKKRVKVPVIPSYVFLRISEQERLSVLQDPGVVNFVFWLGQPAILREEEIIALKNFLEDNCDIEAWAIPFKKGDNVAIHTGPLKDEIAEIAHVNSKFATLMLRGIGYELKARVRVTGLRYHHAEG